MEEKDLLDLLDSDEKPFEKEDKALDAKKFAGKPKKENLWTKLDFTPRKLELEKMTKVGKSFAWYVYLTENSIPEETKKKILSLMAVLGKKEFVFRTIADKTDTLGIAMLAVADLTSEVYLPWPKFNENMEEPTLSFPKEPGYEVAKAYDKFFDKKKPAMRAIYASQAHTLVGEKADNPVDFLICYTEGGSEGFKKGYDYKKEGSLGYYIAICNELNIPIFNLKNDESFKRLVKLLA